MKVWQNYYQFQGAAFGLSTLPQIWMMVMKTLSRLWRRRGILCFIYLDDISVIIHPPGDSKETRLYALDFGGSRYGGHQRQVNFGALPGFRPLGFHHRFQQGCLSVPPQKIKAIRKEFGKLLTHQDMSCRKIAAILGALRSFLMAMPFLRALTDQMCHFVQLHQVRGRTTPSPSLPSRGSQTTKYPHPDLEG